ncbi:hypothetical protein COU17_02840 [Candidatus Kaiserbacteria bacterium CG10_big_fil_rev_8_21_14_0_10_49_17]|uniref:O-antigen ligase-related domain-containing protein n=1 Tax=Candidatus Kaiserbacteria bacterium CG10_big_fil_rev_8_21_14_0_10_49_17 TaxID=1974609 RepID=A0A2M6WDY3_9BACT|nr:MAG: hypothetical protein COU17_02840 [Candidatus Kaiserbacteria bacterium CG10_big_fil_rev_8_21_14_0_10_49_17]
MNWQKLLRNILISGIFVVPFIPLIVSNSMFFPFITGKNFFFRILVELLLGGWLVLALADSQYRPRFSWLLIAFALFVSVIGVADALGENPFKSFWSNFERMEGFVTLIHLFAYFLIVTAVLNTRKLWERFAATSIGVSVIIGIYGLFQVLGFITINQGGVRLDGTFGNASYLGGYMLVHLLITLVFILQARATLWRFVFGAAFLLQAITLYHTATRGAILGFIGALLLTTLLFALFGRGFPKVRKMSIGTLLAVLLLIGGFLAIKDSSLVKSSPVLSRFSNISLNSADARFYVWEMGIEGFKERPVLGWGQENFNYVFNAYYDPVLYDQEQWFDRVHNIVLDWLVAGGILGLLGYLSLYGLTLYYLWRRKESFSFIERCVLTGLVAGYFFHNLFVFDNIGSYLFFVSFLGFIHVRQNENGQDSENRFFEIDSGLVLKAIAPIVVVLIAGGIYFINVKGILSSRALLHALTPQGSLETNVDFFERALSYNSFGKQEIREQLAQGASTFAGNNSVGQATKERLFALTKAEMEKMIEESPNDARVHLFFASVLRSFGQNKAAFDELEKARALSPRKQHILFEIGITQLNAGNTAEALQTMKEAFELEPRFTQARIFYALAAVYDGNSALADELLTDEYKTAAYVQNDYLLQAYASKQQFNKVKEVWETRISAQPENPRAYLGLAGAELALGNREAAIAAIEKAMELDPSLKEQGEAAIDDIKAGRSVQ